MRMMQSASMVQTCLSVSAMKITKDIHVLVRKTNVGHFYRFLIV